MVAARNLQATGRDGCARCRIRQVTVDDRAQSTVLETGCGAVRVAAVPDPVRAGLATAGMRRLHHLVIDVSGATASCTVAGRTRRLVRRRLPLAAALALAAQGVPAFITAGEEV
jgi:hypothetical protein